MAKTDDLLKVPFAYGGRGPDSYDCWGLVHELLRRDGQPVHDVPSPSRAAIAMAMSGDIERAWQPCVRKPGAVMLIRILGFTTHVGYVLDDYRFIHCWEGSKTVVIERIADWERRVAGYYELKAGA